MKIQGISKHFAKFSIAAMTIAAGSAVTSCIWNDERYQIEKQAVKPVENKNETQNIFNNFLKDVGILPSGYRIENIPSVMVESKDGDKIYSIYDKSLNTTNSDSLWLRQLVIHPDNKYNTDTFLFRHNNNNLCVENKNKTIKNVILSKNKNNGWEEITNNKVTARWYNVDDTLFVRDTGKKCYYYKNPKIKIPPSDF